MCGMIDLRSAMSVRRCLVAALLIHLVFVVVRMPRVAWQKRAEQIESYRVKGGARFHLEKEYPQEARMIAWLAANTSPNSVILYRGPQKGVLEFVPALLFPRLIVRQPEGAIPKTISDRELARGQYESSGEGIFVLVADGSGCKLETL